MSFSFCESYSDVVFCNDARKFFCDRQQDGHTTFVRITSNTLIEWAKNGITPGDNFCVRHNYWDLKCHEEYSWKFLPVDQSLCCFNVSCCVLDVFHNLSERIDEKFPCLPAYIDRDQCSENNGKGSQKCSDFDDAYKKCRGLYKPTV